MCVCGGGGAAGQVCRAFAYHAASRAVMGRSWWLWLWLWPPASCDHTFVVPCAFWVRQVRVFVRVFTSNEIVKRSSTKQSYIFQVGWGVCLRVRVRVCARACV